MGNSYEQDHDGVEINTSQNDLSATLKRFMALNNARMKRTREATRERSREFLDLLPLLFDVNHPMLPGYVSRLTPAGIPGYDPTPAALHAAKKHAKSFNYRKDIQRQYPIRALYLMGSAGTVAQSESSDFDIWLCHDPKLNIEEIEQLQQKAEKIEKWAEALGAEVHFFLINPETFGSGDDKQLSSESSGSAQHNLLLEEFYRTSILVCGCYPMWWMVPPENEADYEVYTEALQLKRFRLLNDAIDFGGLAHIPAEEFFGAAVWQLSKGIDSPYKSVLKLLLIEAYASEYPYIELLSIQYKKAVYAGNDDLNSLDPYLMMLDKVDKYLEQRNENERLEVARRCFYFKINDKLSARTQGFDGWRRMLINNRIRNWNWDRPKLILLDTKDDWKVAQVTEERRTLFETLAGSYRFLSDFARQYAGTSMISQRDLNILGRKLYSAYERKAGKIELLNRGMMSNLRESHLTLHEIVDDKGQVAWLLYSGVVNAENVRRHKPIKRMRSIVELAAWCYFNGVLDPNTSIAIYQRGSGFNLKDFQNLILQLRNEFPITDFDSHDIDVYARPATITRGALFLNMGVKAKDRNLLMKETGNAGSSDALSFGIGNDNLVVTVDQVLVTSWHEVITHRYSGAKGLVECLRDYLKWSPPSKGQMPPNLSAHGLAAYKGMTVAHRVQELFKDVVTCYYGGKYDNETRYVLNIGHGYFVLQFEGDMLRFKALDSMAGLIRYLGRLQKTFSQVVIDRHALKRTVLPVIYSRNKPGLVQFFYRINNSEVEVYVLDERGSLFFQRTAFYNTSSLLIQYSRFFEAVLNRMNFLMQEGETVTPAEGVEFYALSRDNIGQYSIERKAPEFNVRDKQFFSLQVMVDVDEAGKTVFTLYCDEKEFSTIEHGGGLFNAVVDYVMEMRSSGQTYPIYITDISLARPVLGEQGASKMQTVQFLNHKVRIEEQLNKAMTARNKG